MKLGLISITSDNKGLGQQARSLKQIFDKYIPEHELELYSIPPGSQAYKTDETITWNINLQRWICTKNYIITIELFMANIFEFCRKNGVKTIWIPNREWIPIQNNLIDQFQYVDIIMPTNTICSTFMREKFKLNNIIQNTIAFDLPIEYKEPRETFDPIIHNAGFRGVGDRRNTEFICKIMEEVLAERKYITFILKSQTDCPVNGLRKFGNRFHYFNQNVTFDLNLDFYRQADFSLCPSKWEGNGFAILESLHMGTPVLTMDYPPMNEWVEHQKTGYLCPVEIIDLPLPLPQHGNCDRSNGLGWVNAVKTSKEEFKKGIYWLCDNKKVIYDNFLPLNKETLTNRLNNFIKIWKEVLQ